MCRITLNGIPLITREEYYNLLKAQESDWDTRYLIRPIFKFLPDMDGMNEEDRDSYELKDIAEDYYLIGMDIISDNWINRGFTGELFSDYGLLIDESGPVESYCSSSVRSMIRLKLEHALFSKSAEIILSEVSSKNMMHGSKIQHLQTLYAPFILLRMKSHLYEHFGMKKNSLYVLRKHPNDPENHHEVLCTLSGIPEQGIPFLFATRRNHLSPGYIYSVVPNKCITPPDFEIIDGDFMLSNYPTLYRYLQEGRSDDVGCYIIELNSTSI